MWVSFPGLRGWWRSRAETCPRSPRGKAGHSRLRVRAVEAPVCGGRTFSLTSCWGSGWWWWWAQAPTWGPQGLRKGSIRPGAHGTAPMLEASSGEIPWCDPEAVPDHLEWLPGHSLSLAATPSPPPVCATAASLQHGPTWLRSVSASSVLSADPKSCALVCLASPGQPWPCSVALCHLLSTNVVTCWTRRSTRAPGILALKCLRLSAQFPAGCRACTARTLWGAGVEVRVPLLYQMCPAGVLGPTSEPAGPSMRVSPSELRGRTAASLVDGAWGIVRPCCGCSGSAGPG